MRSVIAGEDTTIQVTVPGCSRASAGVGADERIVKTRLLCSIRRTWTCGGTSVRSDWASFTVADSRQECVTIQNLPERLKTAGYAARLSLSPWDQVRARACGAE